LQQLEKILTFTGKPSQDDIEALKSDLAKSMIEQTQITKYKTAKETFPYCPDNMVDLVTGLLQFNPNKRLTAEQVLRHPYVKAFAGKGSDSKANNIFKVKQD
jgi:serine/threonine protein kinase